MFLKYFAIRICVLSIANFQPQKLSSTNRTSQPTKKNHFCTTTTKKRLKKAPLKIHYFKKTLKKSVFTRVKKILIFFNIIA